MEDKCKLMRVNAEVGSWDFYLAWATIVGTLRDLHKSECRYLAVLYQIRDECKQSIDDDAVLDEYVLHNKKDEIKKRSGISGRARCAANLRTLKAAGFISDEGRFNPYYMPNIQDGKCDIRLKFVMNVKPVKP